MDKDLENLRKDLIGELEAINQYQEHINQSNYEEVKHILEHIRDEEKEHVAELVQPIRKLDNAQEEKFRRESEN